LDLASNTHLVRALFKIFPEGQFLGERVRDRLRGFDLDLDLRLDRVFLTHFNTFPGGQGE
jgi:hypothetical protein